MRDERTSKKWILVAIWLIAVALAATLDRPVALWARDSGAAGFLQDHGTIRETLKSPGFFPFTVLLAILASFLHSENWRAGLLLLLAGASSAINEVVKRIAGRTRPFKIEPTHQRLAPFELHPFAGGKNLSFPSGHACLAFATAAALSMLWPRGRWVFYSLASLVAIERFMETAHWLSDTVAAAGIGIAGAYLVARFFNAWMKQRAISRS